MPDLLFTLNTGIAVGLALGLTGSGGSLFAIPILIYLLGFDMDSAVPLSLLVVGATALVGAVSAFSRQLLLFRPTLIFGAAGMLCTPLGIAVGEFTPELYRVLGFAALTIVMALRMLWQSRDSASSAVVRAGLTLQQPSGVCRYSPEGKLRFTLPCAVALSLSGAVTGVMSGFFGVGGGFLIVPILMFIIRMDMAHAVGSSLAIIAMIGITGGALGGIPIMLASTTAVFFGVGSLLGMAVGRVLSHRLAGPILQRLFAAGLLATGVIMLIRLQG